MAAFRTKDRVLETSTTTGTGTYTLAGAVTGYQTFLGGNISAADLVPYYVEDGTNWEVGIGTLASGPATLARTHVLASSNSGSAVNWGTGTRNVRLGWPAAMGAPRVTSVSIAGGAGDTTLTQNEQRAEILILTGALTGNRNAIVDATPWRWIVLNNTSGAFTATVKVSGQTGVAVTQGKSRVLYCDGTDVEDGMTDGAGLSLTAASDSSSGVIEIAVQSEMETGTDTTRAVTPGRQQYHPSAAKATCNWSSSGTIEISFNVSSITDTAVGNHLVNFTTAFSAQAKVIPIPVPYINATATMSNPGYGATGGSVQVVTYDNVATGTYSDGAGRWFIAVFGDH